MMKKTDDVEQHDKIQPFLQTVRERERGRGEEEATLLDDRASDRPSIFQNAPTLRLAFVAHAHRAAHASTTHRIHRHSAHTDAQVYPP